MGTGSSVLRRTAPCAVVASGSVCVPDVTLLLYAPPSCKFTTTGSRLPPIRRNPSDPPNDVTRVLKVAGRHDDAPAVRVPVPTPRDRRAPEAVPLRASAVGCPQAAGIATPPPLGPCQRGQPGHCPAP